MARLSWDMSPAPKKGFLPSAHAEDKSLLIFYFGRGLLLSPALQDVRELPFLGAAASILDLTALPMLCHLRATDIQE